jgi:NitT/TauT family transport system substrate-binding protein
MIDSAHLCRRLPEHGTRGTLARCPPPLSRRALARLAGCVLLFPLGGGCRRPAGEQPIRLQLNWMPDAQHGGFYAAEVQGHFRREGLDVRILPGGPGTPVIPKVALGQATFGIANADQVLLAREQEADTVAVFAALQDSPRCIMVHEASQIRSFDGLRDLVLGLGEGKAFAEYLKRRLELKGVRIVPYSGSIAKFLVDPGFAQQGYIFSEPVVARAQGARPVCLMVSDLGFNPYSSVVVTRRRTWRERPELVRRFVRAVRLGWQDYLRDPVAANAAILRENPQLDAHMLDQAAAVLRPLCLPPGVGPDMLGGMRPERWRTLFRQLTDLELLAGDARVLDGAFVEVPD